MMKIIESKENMDKIGIGLSGLCLVHCLLTPALIIAAPVVQNEFFHGLFHKIMFVLVVLVALTSFLPAYKKHRQAKVLVLAAIGAIILFISALDPHFIHAHNTFPYFEYIFTSIGGIFLMLAHFSNIRCVHSSCKH